MESNTKQRCARPLSRGELTGIFVFWTFIAMLGTANRLLDPRESGSPAPGFGHSIAPEFFEAWVWAVFTPLIFWLVDRLHLRRDHWFRPALGLTGLGLFISVFVDVVEDLFEAVILGVPAGAGTSPLSSIQRMWFLNELMVYAGVVAAGLARAYFIRYSDRREEAMKLQAHAARLETQLAEARLEALRMQVNPHFLFNALHAVSSLVHRDPDAVRGMIANLASLMRETLRNGSESVVPLERELEVLERYLDIMRVRFQGRLDVDFDMDPAVLDALIPYLILQPLVENAVMHGVARSDGSTHILISAVVEGSDLVLAVLDDGPGPDQQEQGAAGGGIGLRNVRERLAELFGDGARFQLLQREGGGARAEVRLPLRFEESMPDPPPIERATVEVS